MKNQIIKTILSLLVIVLIASACKKEEEPQYADLTVTCIPMDGETVDVSTLTVELHKSALFDDVKHTSAAGGSANSSVANFFDLSPGKLYLMAWKDLDNSGTFSSGDVFGFHTKPVNISAGNDMNITLEMYEL